MPPDATATFTTAPRFRQRKISLKQHLRILWERDLPEFVEDVRGDLLGIVDTGVDKSEEDERHLQAVLSASRVVANTAKVSTAFIPTPEASKKWGDYSSFYKPGWIETDSYIRSSATVEDAAGTEYNMDEVDAEFLTELNKDAKDAKQRCSEDEFEVIAALIERIVAEKQPFLATDPTQLMKYDEIEPLIIDYLEQRRRASRNPLDPDRLLMEAHSEDYAPKYMSSPYRPVQSGVKLFGRRIFDHWRKRKLERHGKSIFPSLRHESGLSSDDTDPYVTFRRREVRHTRKTRRTDQQNSGRLRKLHGEMRDARSLFELILSRERVRLQQIQSDFEIFELRCRVKGLKRKLHVGAEPDDVELLVSVPKRVRKEEQARLQREAKEKERREKAAQEKLERDRQNRETREARESKPEREPKKVPAITTGSRIPGLEHVTIEQQIIEREVILQQAIKDKLRQRSDADKDYINLSENIYVPYIDFFRELHEPGSTRSSRAILWSKNRTSNKENSSETTDERLSLPLSRESPVTADMPIPEIVAIDAQSDIARYSEVDFERHPRKFSVPLNAPQVSLRHSVFGPRIVDRVFSQSDDSLSKFGKDLAISPKSEADERLADRYKFATDEPDLDYLPDLSNDPATLNEILPHTQELRFGSMLTAKANEYVQEAQTQRRRALQAAAKRQTLQQQQQQRAIAEQQRNAQAQPHAMRVQQAQRVAQRQAQRRIPPRTNALGTNGQTGGGTLTANDGELRTTSSQSNGASNGSYLKSGSAGANAAPTPRANDGNSSAVNGAKTVQGNESGSVSGERQQGIQTSSNGEAAQFGQQTPRQASPASTPSNQARLTPQPPEVEASV